MTDHSERTTAVTTRNNHPRRPYRSEYETEPEWLHACMAWLDHTFPKRVQQQRRIQEWAALYEEGQVAAIVTRIRDLLDIAEWTPEQKEEADRLCAEYLSGRAAARARMDRMNKENAGS
jgi:hypothetical protein